MVREFNWVSTGHLLLDAPQARCLLMSGIAMTTPRDHTTLITLAEPKELPEPPIETNTWFKLIMRFLTAHQLNASTQRLRTQSPATGTTSMRPTMPLLPRRVVSPVWPQSR